MKIFDYSAYDYSAVITDGRVFVCNDQFSGSVGEVLFANMTPEFAQGVVNAKIGANTGFGAYFSNPENDHEKGYNSAERYNVIPDNNNWRIVEKEFFFPHSEFYYHEIPNETCATGIYSRQDCKLKTKVFMPASWFYDGVLAAKMGFEKNCISCPTSGEDFFRDGYNSAGNYDIVQEGDYWRIIEKQPISQPQTTTQPMENNQFLFSFYNHYLSSLISNAFKICREVDDKTVALVYYNSCEFNEDYAAGIIKGYMGRKFDSYPMTQLGIDEHQDYDIIPEGSNWRIIEKQSISQTTTTTQPMDNTTCNKCNGVASPSTALHHEHNQPCGTGFKQDHLATNRVECLKCKDCGHSWVPEKQQKEKPAKKYYANRDSNGKPIYVGDTVSIYLEDENGLGVVTLSTPTVIKVKLGNHNYTTDVLPVDGKVFTINGENAEVYVYDDSFLKSLFHFVQRRDTVVFQHKDYACETLYKIWCYVHGFIANEKEFDEAVDHHIFDTIRVPASNLFIKSFPIPTTTAGMDKILHECLTHVSTIYTKTIKQLAPIFREHTFGSPIDKFAEYCGKQGIEFVK